MLTGLGKMVYLRGGMDKLPGHLQTIISLSSSIFTKLFHISEHANIGSLKRQTICGNPEKQIRRKLIALCIHGGNQSTGRLWHRIQRNRLKIPSFGELLQHNQQIELEFAFVGRRASEVKRGSRYSTYDYFTVTADLFR
jgi:hypothetical protein